MKTLRISAIRSCRQRLQLATDAPTESLFPRSLGLEPKPPELLEGLRYRQWTDVNDDSRMLTPAIEEAFQVRGRDVVHVAVNRYIEERNERLDSIHLNRALRRGVHVLIGVRDAHVDSPPKSAVEV